MTDKSIPNRPWAGTGRKENVNSKQKHPVEDFPEEVAAETEKLGPGKLKQRPFKKGGKVK